MNLCKRLTKFKSKSSLYNINMKWLNICVQIYSRYETHITCINIPNRMVRKLIIRDLLLSLIWYGVDHEQK